MLYRDHATGLRQYAMAMSHRGDVAADALQEAFLRYFAERKYGRRIDNPRAWLYRVLHNYLVSCAHAVAARREDPLLDTAEIPSRKQDLDATLYHAQAAREIASSLSARELDCLRLRSRGLSYDEIGDVLGIRPGTVSALLTRVHRKLRDTAGSRAREDTAGALRALLGEGALDAS